MAKMRILSSEELKHFENPPETTLEEKEKYFILPSWFDSIESRNPVNSVGLILMLGYFRMTGRFFVSSKFNEKDIAYIIDNLKIPQIALNLDTFQKATYGRYKQLILEHSNVETFTEKHYSLLITEAKRITPSKLRPKQIFYHLLEYLNGLNIEIPTYHVLSNVIVKVLNEYEQTLAFKIKDGLTNDAKMLLDELLEETVDSKTKQLKMKKYKITKLKRIEQSIKPSKIKKNTMSFESLKKIYDSITQVVTDINLSEQTVRYYASKVIRSEIFQIARRADENKYLHLICFVLHQFYNFHDALADILIKSVNNTINSTVRDQKVKYFDQRKEQHQAIIELKCLFNNEKLTLKEIETIINADNMTDYEKVCTIKDKLSLNQTTESKIEQHFEQLEKTSKGVIEDKDYYNMLESKSRRLQLKISEILKAMVFDTKATDEKIFSAIMYYKDKDGNIDKNAPTDFLEEKDKKQLFDDNGTFRVSLYKVLLFINVADGIKSGTINLNYSYRHKSIEEYLISKDVWKMKRSEYLNDAGLNNFADVHKTIDVLKDALENQYHITNQNIKNGFNKYIKFNKDGSFILNTPPQDEKQKPLDIELFPQNDYIPLIEVLSTVNKHCNYLDAFEHELIKYSKPKPQDKVFHAGSIGYGCNVGKDKIAKISKGINENELKNAFNWYFNVDNVNCANDKILSFTNKLKVTKLKRNNPTHTHTSSDGQKYNAGVSSLNASASFKYHGQKEGMTSYTFTDDRELLFYSRVITSSDREAAYVIDGLTYNEDIVKSDIHSTDTHGYTEAIFAITHLLGFSFAPRIKNLKEQQLYSFTKRKLYSDIDYKILPDKYVDIETIKDFWDDILRFVTTIKLKITQASQLFKRLSSYSKYHPLYLAIKAFGQIIKSIFILKYIDDVELRQAIARQLNIGEHSNKFSKAVFYGNNQEFIYATKEEQEIADGCKRLIKNAIVCWNYLYLSQMLLKASSPTNREKLVQKIKTIFVETWKHINLHGEFDFSDEKLEDKMDFDIPSILNLDI